MSWEIPKSISLLRLTVEKCILPTHGIAVMDCGSHRLLPLQHHVHGPARMEDDPNSLRRGGFGSLILG